MRGQGIWLRGISGLGMAFLYLPIIVLVVFSFNASRLSATWQGFSWHWYGVLWHDEALLAAAANSLWVAVLSTSLVVLLGVPAAMGLERLRGRGGQALGEAAQAAEAAGLDRDAAMEVLNEGAAGSRTLKNKLPKMFKRDFSPQFQLELMDKDLRYFLALAQELDRPAPIASLVRSQYQAARRAQLGKLDSCAVFLQGAGERPKA